MFERYTEKARRVIFFARYEASQFGSPCIETEHLLLGLVREDKALVDRFKIPVETIRRQIEQHTIYRDKVSTSVDMPLSHECKRVLAFAAEEAERLNHKHIHTDHLLLGLMREELGYAANLLAQQGLHLHPVREEVREHAQRTAREFAQSSRVTFTPQPWTARLRASLAEREKRGGITVAAWPTIGSHTPDFAVYTGDPADHDGDLIEDRDPGHPITPAQLIATHRRKIRVTMNLLEKAIVMHEFEKARLYSEEERKEREAMRQLREQHDIAEPLSRTPFLCIEFARKESLGEWGRRVDRYLAAGAEQVWLLDPENKKAYTANLAEGVREFKGQILETHGVELALPEIFA